MTEKLDIQIVQGQRWTYLFRVADLVTENSGLRLHIRDHHGATLLRAALTHDGDTNARVSFTDGGILANLGATISTGWNIGESATRRWVYSVERYSLSDADDVTVTHYGTCVVIANPTDENSVDEVAPFPSFNLFALRFDIEQVLTEEQRLRVLTTLGITPGGSPTVVHADTTLRDATDSHPMAAITGLVAALTGKETAGSVATHDADTGAHGQTATGRAVLTAASTAAARTAIGLGNVDNTSDAGKPISTATQTALDGKQSTSEKGSAGGYASLDSGGKVPQAQLPAIAITEYLGEVANQTAMLALSGQKGDWCIRTDTGAVWIITGTDPTLIGSWTSVSYPASPVTSVAGRTGDVTISAGDVSGLSTVAATGAYSDLSGKPTLGTAAATDTTDYATPAQGAKADTAVQPARAINTQHSLTGGGDLSADRTLALVGDTASPGNNKVYGTDGSGTRGWKDDPAGGGSPAGLSGQGQFNNDGSFGALPLWRVDANTLLQRNSTNAQEFCIANTYAGASDYESGGFRWVSNELQIGTFKAGTGSTRAAAFFVGGIRIFNVTLSGTLQMAQTGYDGNNKPVYAWPYFGTTATVTTYTLSAADYGKKWTVNSASDQNWTMIASPTDGQWIIIVMGAAKAGSYMRLTANTGQTILLPSGKSASAGYVRTNSADAAIKLFYDSNRSMWISGFLHGTWTIDS